MPSWALLASSYGREEEGGRNIASYAYPYGGEEEGRQPTGSGCDVTSLPGAAIWAWHSMCS